MVLAAGEARRFGTTKQIAPYNGKPLAQHAIDTLADSALDEIVIVTGHDADAVEAALELPPRARFVRNPDYADGQSTSLAAALHALDAESEGAVILMADQPGVTSEDIHALVDGFRPTRAAIVRIRYTDGPGPALLSREIYGQAGHLHGDAGARLLMASHPEWVVDVDVDRPAPADVDEPGDLPTPT